MAYQPATFAAVFVALYVAHQVADHWIQTQHQAAAKGRPGWPGRIACACHVSTYTLAGLAAVGLVAWRCGLHIAPGRLVAGLAVSAVTHYVVDRRTPLRRLAELVGSGEFYAFGAPRSGRDDNPSMGTGAYALDQSWHILWLGIAALIVV